MTMSTADRVTRNTSSDINESIREAAERRVRHYAKAPAGIDARLRELDAEWDIERAIEANAATLAFVGTFLGATRHRRWLMLPAAVSAFLLQHAVQGWCPPVPLLRRLGFRTAREIETERNALKALRGDYSAIGTGAGEDGLHAEQALAAVRR